MILRSPFAAAIGILRAHWDLEGMHSHVLSTTLAAAWRTMTKGCGSALDQSGPTCAHAIMVAARFLAALQR